MTIDSLLLKKIEAERILYFAFDKYSLDKTPEAFIFLIKNYFERRLKKKVFEIDFKGRSLVRHAWKHIDKI